MYTWNPKDCAQHSRGQEAWARELLTLVDLRPDDIVLDIGCGDGRTTAAIAQSADAFLEDTAGQYLARFPVDAVGRVHVATVRLQVRPRKA